MILEKINKPGDIKKVKEENYNILAEEIRQFLLDKTSITGGHLAANLGVVELTMALHIALNLPEDKIVWDVGHQCYTHKILTGRKEGFDNLRQFGGMSGFPKRHESDCDAFDTGHSSTSISAALGLCVARDLEGKKSTVAAVIGDGALTGGMAYEAMNNSAMRKTNLIVILNDNKMSISPSVGGVSRSLASFRTSAKYNELKSNVANGINSIPKVGSGIYNTISTTKKTIKQVALKNGMLFEELGLKYLGPYDGHNISQMVDAIKQAKKVKGPVLVHVITQKGKGYKPAEADPSRFHGIGAFDIDSGELINHGNNPDYTGIFGKKMVRLAEKDSKIVAITAAMAHGTGLVDFSKKFPDRFFDVGIAEEHAVTFAAGMAAAGLKPVVAIYSSFLQRAYDQIIHDVCLQDLPVVFAIDRSGITGPDGETHHGIFDLSYLSSIPGLTVLAPKNGNDLKKALEYALNYNHPVAIRYPKGEAYSDYNTDFEIASGKSEVISQGTDVTLIAVGSMFKTAVEVSSRLKENNIDCGIVNASSVSPIDTECIASLAKASKLLVTMEENVLNGGYGEHVSTYLMQNGYTNCLNLAIDNNFVCQGTVSQLRRLCGLDAESITEKILKELQ